MIKVKLKDISLNITDGKHGDCDSQDNSGFYFISCKDIHDGKIYYNGARQITEQAYLDTHKRTMLEPNDILITNSGTIGRMAFVKDIPETYRTTFQKSVAIIKPNQKIVRPSYLYYCLINCLNQFINESNGSAQKNLLLGTMREFQLNIEDNFERQDKIANFLHAYDKFIENSQRQIELLEEAAQRLYKEWFVDLHFPGYEKVKVVNGVPEGWTEGTLGDVVEFRRGKTITKAQVQEGSIPVVAGGLEPAYYHNKANTVAPVITVSGSGANAGFSRLYNVDIFASDCSFADSETTPYLFFVYCFLKENRTRLDALQKGAAQPHVYAKDINAMKLTVPTDDKLEAFCKFVFSYFEKIKVLQKQIQISSQARDRLLPKFINGELEV